MYAPALTHKGEPHFTFCRSADVAARQCKASVFSSAGMFGGFAERLLTKDDAHHMNVGCDQVGIDLDQASSSNKRSPLSSNRASRSTSSVKARVAHRSISSLVIRRSGLPAVSLHKAASAGASNDVGGVVRAQQKGDFFRPSLARSFDLHQLVIQRVISLDFFIEAPMLQTELRMLGRLDAPSVVHPDLIAMCKTYRQAVQLCWQMRRVRNMTKKTLAELAGLYAPHVTCYLSDDAKTRRDLPGSAVKAFELACGNTAISQWHALNAQLTCLESIQAGNQKVAA